MKVITWNRQHYSLELHNYRDAAKRTAVVLVNNLEPDDPSYGVVASVNLPADPLPEGCVFFKTWSGNEGLLEALQAAGLVGPTLGAVATGFVEAPYAQLLATREDVRADHRAS